MNSSTAILLFSRTAAAETRAKAFGKGTQIAESLLRRTERALAKTGLPIVHSNEMNQRGTTFGQRMANAVSEVFDQGYARVIVVGSDCASIQTSHLRAAAQMLERGENVLGPDHRGGAWLIGLQRADFNPVAFADLCWETSSLYEDLAGVLPATTQLARLHDLNASADFRRLWHVLRTRFGQLYHFVFRAVASFFVLFAPAQNVVANGCFLRGPPAA